MRCRDKAVYAEKLALLPLLPPLADIEARIDAEEPVSVT